ncbi:MAG: hypothetical protein JWP97_6089 [Labilithrix sp.]|nr:hypothetical protein [Labilithrix sp.]
MLDDDHNERLAFGPMKRAILTAFLAGTALLTAIPACKDEGVGDPCTPEQEYDPSFTGFNENEVNVESKSFQCRTRICLVNHFRGRASCPYGQSASGVAPTGADPCTVPGTADKITGLANPGDPTSFVDPSKQASVPPQCVDRAADKAVYCSCRCADINGDKPGDQTFCDCPDGFACTPLVTSIGRGNEGLTGSYCIKNDTAYNRDTACNQGDCDPATKKCGG